MEAVRRKRSPAAASPRTMPYSALAVMQCLLVAACGGGSSGGASNQTPPPAAPPLSVVIDPTEKTVLSGAVFVASLNGEADGSAAPPISVACTGGAEPVVDGSRVTVSAPEVAALTQLVCTASVTDSAGRTASEELTITILPKTDVGQVVGIFDPPLKLVLSNYNVPPEIESYGSHVVAIADSSNLTGGYALRAIEGTSSTPRQYDRDDIVLIEGDYLSVDFAQSPSLGAHGLPDASMTIGSLLEDRIYWLAQEHPSRVFTVREVIDVSNPCHVAQTSTMWANDLIVGQVDDGLSVFDIETGSDVMYMESFNATFIQTFGVGRSLCQFMRGILPASVMAQYPGYTGLSPFDPAYALPLTAIDYKTNELVYYGDPNYDNVFDEMGTTRIETNSASKLDIVQVLSRGGPSYGPRYFLVLFSDGNATGEHRLVQINFNTQIDEFEQQILYEWSEGVPVSMIQGALGGSLDGGIYSPDLVVVLGTTEHSLFFENIHPPQGLFDDPPQYGEPTLFKVGTGAGSAVGARSPYAPNLEQADDGVLVSYPESGYVIYISLPVVH
jgi:hypothetical protein